MREVTVRLKPPGIGVWGTIGVDYGPGIWPQGVQMTANQAGPDTCSFVVRRDARLPWTELLPYATVEVEVEGSGVVWGGRVWDVQYPNAEELSVSCRGYQYALEDNVMLRTWVLNGTQWYVDARTFPGYSTGIYPPAGEYVVQTGTSINMALPSTALTLGQTVTAVLDLGVADAKEVSIDWVNLGNTSANLDLYVLGADDPLISTGVVTGFGTATNLLGATGTVDATFASSKRYVAIQLYVSAGYTPGATPTIQITGSRVFRDATYVASSVSDLHADAVIKDVRAALLSSVLSTDESQIAATTFDIPHMSTVELGANGYATPRQIFNAVNAFHDYLLGVDANARIFFQPRPTQPETEIGEWGGADFSDAGDSGEELYNRVLVQYTDGSGGQATLDASSTSPLLGLGGLTRAKILTVNSPIDSTAATEIATKWLEARVRRPTRGSVVVRGSGGARYCKGGAPVNPADYLTQAGQMLRLTHRWDPDTGGWGRDAYITSVTYTPDGDTATLTLDSPRDRLDVVLGRYAAVRGAGLPLS